MTLGIGATGSPVSTKRFDDYNYTGGDHPFPSNKMVVDITEFIPYMSGPPDNFFLGVYDGGSAIIGFIDFFSIEMYDDYGSGVPTETFVSTDPPVNTANFSTVYAQVTSGVPTLTVTSPNGGEDWEVGSNQTITWISTGSISDVKLEYSTNSGTDWITIIASTPNDGSYPWTVPATPSANCLVKVSDALDGDPWDVSDNPFTITQPTLTVTSPNGGEDWEVGSNQTITWTSTGSISDVKLEYTTNGGTDWTTIEASTPNDGSHPWTVPAIPSANCLVKVSDALDGDPWDVSDNPFTLSNQTHPSQITNLEATSTDTSIILKWSPASDNIGVHHYLIYRDTTSGFMPSDSITATPDTVYIDLEAASGVTYYYRVSAVDSSGNEGEYSNEAQATIPTGIKAESILKYPQAFFLMQNYPDPFNQMTEIGYTLPQGAQVKLEVYNLLGQKVATLVDQRQTPGNKVITWDASSFTSGVYIYRLCAGAYTQARKMVLLK